MLGTEKNPAPTAELKKEWTPPHFAVYGDMAALTQQHCGPNDPHCKPKNTGLADDFGSHFSTLGG